MASTERIAGVLIVGAGYAGLHAARGARASGAAVTIAAVRSGSTQATDRCDRDPPRLRPPSRDRPSGLSRATSGRTSLASTTSRHDPWRAHRDSWAVGRQRHPGADQPSCAGVTAWRSGRLACHRLSPRVLKRTARLGVSTWSGGRWSRVGGGRMTTTAGISRVGRPMKLSGVPDDVERASPRWIKNQLPHLECLESIKCFTMSLFPLG